jgi:hypothetical protein
MNLIGRVNIELNEIIKAFPEPPKVAERDLRHRSSNLTFFKWFGMLAMAGLLFAIHHICNFISNGLASIGLYVGTGTIAAAILIALFVAIWILLIRWWYLSQKRIPDMSDKRLSTAYALGAFMKLSKVTHSGINEGLSSTRKLALRIFSQANDATVHEFVSRLIHLVRSDVFQELTAGAPTLKANLDHLEQSLVACLEGKEVLPPKSITAGVEQRLEIFNPVTTQVL